MPTLPPVRINSQTASIQLAAADATCERIVFVNDDVNGLYFLEGAGTAGPLNYTYILYAGDEITYTGDDAKQAFNGAWAADGAGGCQVTKVTNDGLTGSVHNFGSLKNAIAQRLGRSNMTALIPDFIATAQSQMMHGHEIEVGPRGLAVSVPPLRISDMLATETLTPTDGEADLPDDYLEAKLLVPQQTDAAPLAFRPPEVFSRLGSAAYFTITGSVVKFATSQTSPADLTYYAQLAAFTSDTDTDAVLQKAWHAYLYGALAEAYEHIRQTDRAERYFRQFAGAVRSLNNRSDDGQMSGSVLVAVPDFTP